jgi:hypothetical protein
VGVITGLRALSFRVYAQEDDVRFRVDVNTLDGKLSFEKDIAADAIDVANGARESLGVTITDTEEGQTYSAEEFRTRFGH